MTLRDTELIGRRLVKYGFYRSKTNHHAYGTMYKNPASGIDIIFTRYNEMWVADFIHNINHHTVVKFNHHEAIFTPEWLVEEHKKLQAMFKFLRS